jgi:hypothetical protein
VGCNINTWGNIHGEPFNLIEEAHDNNYVKISIYKTNDLFAYGFQLKMGTVIRQKVANIGGAVYKTMGAAREAAGKEVAAVCATNKNSKKYFLEFKNICYIDYDLFGGLL